MPTPTPTTNHSAISARRPEAGAAISCALPCARHDRSPATQPAGLFSRLNRSHPAQATAMRAGPTACSATGFSTTCPLQAMTTSAPSFGASSLRCRPACCAEEVRTMTIAPGSERRPMMAPGSERRPMMAPGSEGQPTMAPGSEGRPMMALGSEGQPTMARGSERRPMMALGSERRPMMALGSEGRSLRIAPRSEARPTITHGWARCHSPSLRSGNLRTPSLRLRR